MNTDTPRTDANVKRHNLCQLSGNNLVYADFPRQLERELTAARAEISHMVSENGNMYLEIFIARNQRDRLAEALKKLLTTGDNGYGTPTDKAWEMAEQAIAAVKGGSEKPVNLIHNGVGIADMYSRDEFEIAMKRTQ